MALPFAGNRRLRTLVLVVLLVCAAGVGRMLMHPTPAAKQRRGVFHNTVDTTVLAPGLGPGDALVAGIGRGNGQPLPTTPVDASVDPVLAARQKAAAILAEARRKEAELLDKAVKADCRCSSHGALGLSTPRTEPGQGSPDGSPRFVEVACPDGCSGHGQCLDLYCKCEPGWGGTGCWTKLAPRKSLAEAITLVLVPTKPGDCVAQAMRILHRAWPSLPLVVVARHMKDVAAEVPHSLVAVDATLSKKVRAGVERANTPYAVVMHTDAVLSPFTNLRQVVREMDSTDATFLGGAVEDGGNATEYSHDRVRVTLPCWAMKLANFTLTYAHGSRTHQRSVRVCDRASDSFVLRVQTALRVLRMREDTSGEGWVVEMMLRAKAGGFTVASSPSLQFRRLPTCVQPPYTHSTLKSQMDTVATSVVTMSVVHFPDEVAPPVYPCKGGSSSGKGNKVTSPCKLKKLQEALFLVNDFLEEKQYAFAVSGGAVLSALKMQSLVPWEYDLDVDVWGTAKEFETFMDVELWPFCDANDFTWQWRRAGAAAVVLALTRHNVDVDLYFTILDRPTSFDGEEVPSFDYDLLNKDTWPPPGIHWRNIKRTPGPNNTVYVETPTAQVLIDGHWVRMRAYDWPFIAKKYGTEASLFHVTREMASVNDMMDGGYGAKALTRDSRYCKLASDGGRRNFRQRHQAPAEARYAAYDQGCLDGWVWKQDWRDWPTAFPPPAPPPKEPPPRAPWFRAPSIGLPKTVGMWMVWIVALCCCGALTGVACTMLADKFLGDDDPYYTGDDEGAAGGGSGGVAGQHKRRRPRRGRRAPVVESHPTRHTRAPRRSSGGTRQAPDSRVRTDRRAAAPARGGYDADYYADDSSSDEEARRQRRRRRSERRSRSSRSRRREHDDSSSRSRRSSGRSSAVQPPSGFRPSGLLGVERRY